MPSFDEVLKEAGEFGRFQKRVFFLLCQTGITFSFLFASVVFLGPAPDNYWCRIPGAAELSERCGWTLEEEQNFTVLPLRLENASSSGKCERLDIVWDNSVSCTSPLTRYGNHSVGNLPLAACHDNWVYKQPHSSIVSEYNLVCGNAWMLDLSQAILSLGFLAGSFTLGYAADRYGRILIYLLSCLGVGICGIIVAFAPNFTVFLVFRFLQGVFGKGTWMTCYVIVTEIVGSDQRIVGIVIQMFFTLGIMILPGIAYLVPTWQGIQLVISLPNFLFLLYYWVVPESPRWLLTRKKGEKALKIMHNIAKHNGKYLSPHYSEITISNEEVSNPSFLDLVRTPKMRRNTLIFMYAWFTSALIYQGLVMRLGIVGGNLYLDFFISGAVELPAALLILLTIDRIGRRLPFGISNIVAGIACLITAFLPEEVTGSPERALKVLATESEMRWLPCSVDVTIAPPADLYGFPTDVYRALASTPELKWSQDGRAETPRQYVPWLKTTVATLGRLGITMAFEIVYLVNSELYPTTLRNFGVSLCSSLCDLGGIIAPFLLFRLAAIWLELPLIIFSILAVVCGVLVLLLPETKGISLPETVEDVEQISGHFSKCGKKQKHRDTNSYI